MGIVKVYMVEDITAMQRGGGLWHIFVIAESELDAIAFARRQGYFIGRKVRTTEIGETGMCFGQYYI